MKEMRETTCFNKSAVEVAKEAGSNWKKMTDCDKAKYIVEAYKVSRNKGSECSIGEPKSKVRKTN